MHALKIRCGEKKTTIHQPRSLTDRRVLIESMNNGVSPSPITLDQLSLQFLIPDSYWQAPPRSSPWTRRRRRRRRPSNDRETRHFWNIRWVWHPPTNGTGWIEQDSWRHWTPLRLSASVHKIQQNLYKTVWSVWMRSCAQSVQILMLGDRCIPFVQRKFMPATSGKLFWFALKMKHKQHLYSCSVFCEESWAASCRWTKFVLQRVQIHVLAVLLVHRTSIILMGRAVF